MKKAKAAIRPNKSYARSCRWPTPWSSAWNLARLPSALPAKWLNFSRPPAPISWAAQCRLRPLNSSDGAVLLSICGRARKLLLMPQPSDHMRPTHKILVMTGTYNEIETLPRLVEEIFQYAPQVHFLAIDDNSPDGTGRWCHERASSDSRIHCLHRSGKLGLGTA